MAIRKRKPEGRLESKDPFILELEKVAGILFNPQRQWELQEVLLLLANVRKYPAPTTDALRTFWGRLDSDCSRCAQTLLELYKLRRRSRVLVRARRHRERGVDIDDPSNWEHSWLSSPGTNGAADPLAGILTNLKEISAQLVRLSELGKQRRKATTGRKGRSCDFDLRWLAEELYGIYLRAGGKSTLYWYDAGGQYRGPFLRLVIAIANFAHLPYTSQNAIAQTVAKVVRHEKRWRDPP